MATISFTAEVCAATIRERRLTKSSVYLLQARPRPLLQYYAWMRLCVQVYKWVMVGGAAASIQERLLFLPAEVQVRLQFESGDYPRAESGRANTVHSLSLPQEKNNIKLRHFLSYKHAQKAYCHFWSNSLTQKGEREQNIRASIAIHAVYHTSIAQKENTHSHCITLIEERVPSILRAHQKKYAKNLQCAPTHKFKTAQYYHRTRGEVPSINKQSK